MRDRWDDRRGREGGWDDQAPGERRDRWDERRMGSAERGDGRGRTDYGRGDDRAESYRGDRYAYRGGWGPDGDGPYYGRPTEDYEPSSDGRGPQRGGREAAGDPAVIDRWGRGRSYGRSASYGREGLSDRTGYGGSS